MKSIIDLRAGDRVEIISPISKYKGYKATVCKTLYRCGTEYVAIYPDGVKHYHPKEDENSSDKYLKLVITSVKKIEGEKNKMKLDGYKKVAIINNSYGNYHYALYNDEIQNGDKVIVSGKGYGQVLKIEEVLTVEEARKNYTKEITEEVICKIDTTEYDNRVERRITAEKIKLEMDKEIRKMQETNKYEIYARENPDLAKMLENYKSLIG